MMRFHKTFEHETYLTLNQCKSRIEEKYPPKLFIGSTDIVTDSINLDANQLSVSLLQSRIRGLFLKMEFQITPTNSGVIVQGVVGMNTLNLIVNIYFIIITPILAVIFRPVPFLAIVFLLAFLVAVGFLRDILQHRDLMIQTVRMQLTS